VNYRVTDAALYREQDAPFHMFSKRWKSMDLVDITDWADEEVRTIHISLDFLEAPFPVHVRRFVPVEGDLLEETWVDKNGNQKMWPVPPYAIVRMAEAADAMGEMIEKQVGNYITSLLGGGTGTGHDLLWQTYLEAFRYAGVAPVGIRLPTYYGTIVANPCFGRRQENSPFFPTPSVSGLAVA
jgi:hypothetical protein